MEIRKNELDKLSHIFFIQLQVKIYNFAKFGKMKPNRGTSRNTTWYFAAVRGISRYFAVIHVRVFPAIPFWFQVMAAMSPHTAYVMVTSLMRTPIKYILDHADYSLGRKGAEAPATAPKQIEMRQALSNWFHIKVNDRRRCVGFFDRDVVPGASSSRDLGKGGRIDFVGL